MSGLSCHVMEDNHTGKSNTGKATIQVVLILMIVMILITIIINLIYIAQFDINGTLTALYIVIKYIQTQYMHIWTYVKQSYSYTYTCLHIYTYTDTHTDIFICDPPPRNESQSAKPTFAVARNLLQGCENVDFEILVVTA